MDTRGRGIDYDADKRPLLLREAILYASRGCNELQARIAAMVARTPPYKVKIISTTWNGQPYGRSVKPLTGQVFPVQYVVVDGREPTVWVKHPTRGTLACGLDDVEFVP